MSIPCSTVGRKKACCPFERKKRGQYVITSSQSFNRRYLHGIPADSRAASSSRFLTPQDITEEKIARVRRLNELANARGQSLAQMAIAWLLREEQLTSVLIGASKVSWIEDCVGTLNLDFTPAELQQIEEILSKQYLLLKHLQLLINKASIFIVCGAHG